MRRDTHFDTAEDDNQRFKNLNIVSFRNWQVDFNVLLLLFRLTSEQLLNSISPWPIIHRLALDGCRFDFCNGVIQAFQARVVVRPTPLSS